LGHTHTGGGSITDSPNRTRTNEHVIAVPTENDGDVRPNWAIFVTFEASIKNNVRLGTKRS
jgi:hypothetical protein